MNFWQKTQERYMNMKALILAGGPGSQMKPLSNDIPTSLLKLQGKTVLERLIEHLNHLSITEILVVCGHLEDQVRRELIRLKSKHDNLTLHAISQGKRQGVAGAILAAESHFQDDETFMLCYGDIIAPIDLYKHLLNSWTNSGADGAIAITLREDVRQLGIAHVDHRGMIKNVIDTVDDVQEEISIEHQVVAGAFILTGAIFRTLAEKQSLGLAINQLIQEQHYFCGARWDDFWIDLGTPWDLLVANQYLLKQVKGIHVHSSADISSSANLKGPVVIDQEVVIEHGATIKGPCYIGSNSYIGTNTLIREFTNIESKNIIGFSVEIKNSVLQDECSVGRLSFIGDSILGRKVTVDSNVTFLNHLSKYRNVPTITIRGQQFTKLGAVIGSNGHLSANVVLYPQTVINSNDDVPPGSIVKKMANDSGE